MVDIALRMDGPRAYLYLRGPLDAAAVATLADTCGTVAEQASVRVLVISAAPTIWSGWSVEAAANAETLGLIGDPFGPLAAVPQPTVVVVAGAVRDAGLELALCADIRIAAPDAEFGLPGVGGTENQTGTMPIAGGLQRLARAVGRARALELVLMGTLISAAAAQRWGLVNLVAADPQVEAEALAGRIAERGPIATRLAKEAVRRGLEMPLDQALRYETDLTVLLQTTADRAEGVRAFIEKRPSHFRGT